MRNLTCPVCKGALREVIREGILIDICTQCHGIWLDRGELEKLLELTQEIKEIPLPPPLQPRPLEADEAHGYGRKKKRYEFKDIFDPD